MATRGEKVVGGMGFTESVTSPCVYVNLETGVRIVTHVGDFLCVGPAMNLNRFHDELK